MAKITLGQAAERSHHVEIICRMMESYPDKMDDSEIQAIATLLRRLSGDVCAFLIEEQATQERRK